MTSFNMALKNVKKSFSDFTIYFMTLTFSVAFFYSFNAIGEVSKFLPINSMEAKLIEGMSLIIYILSFFMIIILGLIIIFSNNFLVRRRSKEIGIYLTLGMDRKKVARIFAIESIIIGFASLLVGIILGIFFSQFMALIVAKYFEMEISNYQFILSAKALIMTSAVYAVIFILVSILNSITISRVKLIDIIHRDKKNEDIKKTGVKDIVMGLFSIIILGTAYSFIIKSQFNPSNQLFLTSIIFGFIGTFMFFRSFTALVLSLIKKNKKLYYKNLNPFILRQIDSRIRTTSTYLALTSIILLVSIGSLTTGYSIIKTIEGSISQVSPLDIHITGQSSNKETILNQYEQNLKDHMGNNVFTIDDYEIPKVDFSIANLDSFTSRVNDILLENNQGKNIDLVSYDDFMDFATIFKTQLPKLNDDEVLIHTNDKAIYDSYKPNLKALEDSLTFNGKTYKIKDIVLIHGENGEMAGTYRVIVNKIPEGFKVNKFTLGGMINNKTREIENSIEKSLEVNSILEPSQGHIFILNRRASEKMFQSMSTTVLFITTFIGVVFLLSAMAIIALRELSEAHDNINKYNMLRRLGVNEEMINKTVLAQQSIYFLMPLLLGLVHTYFGVTAASYIINLFGKYSFLKSAPLPILSILLIYLFYMFITYNNSKKIIKQRVTRS